MSRMANSGHLRGADRGIPQRDAHPPIRWINCEVAVNNRQDTKVPQITNVLVQDRPYLRFPQHGPPRRGQCRVKTVSDGSARTRFAQNARQQEAGPRMRAEASWRSPLRPVRTGVHLLLWQSETQAAAQKERPAWEASSYASRLSFTTLDHSISGPLRPHPSAPAREPDRPDATSRHPPSDSIPRLLRRRIAAIRPHSPP